MQSQALNINLGQDVIADVIGTIIHEKNRNRKSRETFLQIKPRTSIILHNTLFR